MNVFEMVVLIVVFTTIGSIVNNAIKFGKKGTFKSFKDWDWDLDDLWDDDDDDDAYKKSQKKIHRQVDSKYDQKIKTLEERIQVLEAIVTDEKYQLKKEIDKLGV